MSSWEPWVQMLVTFIVAFLGSSGVWTLILKKTDRKDAQKEMLIGMGHDRLMYLASQYIERGWVTKEEYENIATHLYKPYKAMGGNGAITKMMNDVEKLPIRSTFYTQKKEGKE